MFMNKARKKILLCIFLYSGVWIIIKHVPLSFLICRVIPFEIIANVLIDVIKNLIPNIGLAIITGLMVNALINKEADLVFPDYLVIRQRESECVDKKIALCAMIGNKKSGNIYDVECNIICSYIEKNGKRCNVIQKTDKCIYMENFYRFSFEYTTFPKVFWKHFLMPGNIHKDYLIVIITGKHCDLGGAFCAQKRYSLNDIIIGDNADPTEFICYDKSYMNKSKTNWHKFKEIKTYTEQDEKYILIHSAITNFATS